MAACGQISVTSILPSLHLRPLVDGLAPGSAGCERPQSTRWSRWRFTPTAAGRTRNVLQKDISETVRGRVVIVPAGDGLAARPSPRV